jgi:hypothetical protein
MQVTVVPDTSQVSASLTSGDAPVAGFEFVRIGSATDSNRQGSVYLTADDSEAPFIDVVDGISSFVIDSGSGGGVKVRMGKLDGITSATFGSLSGYGI